jgi:broad specificity phosphatase PhoE
MLQFINDRVLLYLVAPGGEADYILDDPLTAEGLEAANEIARFLHFAPFGRVISSDLLSTMQTANAITPDFERNPSLRPSNIGGGETFDEFFARWKQAFDEFVTQAMTSEKPLVLVTHSFNVSVSGMLVNENSDFRTLISPGGIAAIMLSKEQKLSLDPLLGRLHCSSTTTQNA